MQTAESYRPFIMNSCRIQAKCNALVMALYLIRSPIKQERTNEKVSEASHFKLNWKPFQIELAAKSS